MRNNLNYLAERGWCLLQINISSVHWQIVCINHQRYTVPPCFRINIIHREFIAYIKMHHRTVAIIYLCLISIGQKLICQLPGSSSNRWLRAGRAPGRCLPPAHPSTMAPAPLHRDRFSKGSRYLTSAPSTHTTFFKPQRSHHLSTAFCFPPTCEVFITVIRGMNIRALTSSLRTLHSHKKSKLLITRLKKISNQHLQTIIFVHSQITKSADN